LAETQSAWRINMKNMAIPDIIILLPHLNNKKRHQKKEMICCLWYYSLWDLRSYYCFLPLKLIFLPSQDDDIIILFFCQKVNIF
jgi:hypothetical protein